MSKSICRVSDLTGFKGLNVTETINQHRDIEPNSARHKRWGHHPSAMTGKRHKNFVWDSEEEPFGIGENGQSKVMNAKSKLALIFNTLDIDVDVLECLSIGISVDAINTEVRANSRARRILGGIIRRLSDILCPDNSKFKLSMIRCEDTSAVNGNKLLSTHLTCYSTVKEKFGLLGKA